jgi:hypothetical protein
MTATTPTSNSFDMGRVIQRTFGAVRANLVPFGLMAALLYGAPYIGIAFGMLGAFSAMGVPTTVGATPSPSHFDTTQLPLFLSAGAAFWLAFVVAMLVLKAAIVYGTVTYLSDRRASVGESLSWGLRRCVPLFFLGVVAGLAELVGIFLLVFPAVMMAVAWIVAVPALVVERTGIFESLGRSADLTRGRRWPIFGLIVVFGAAYLVLQQVLLALAGIASLGATALDFRALFLRQFIVGGVIGTVGVMISYAGIASIYYELRSTREGIGPEALAAVFD